MVKPRPRSRSSLRPGSAAWPLAPTMKRRANDSISARTARAAAGRSGEWRLVAPIARRRARGTSTPGCRKYSCRWRAISAVLRSVGKTSTKRKSSTLRRSSAMAQSSISSCQRDCESSVGRERSMSAKRARAVACMSASRPAAPASPRGDGSFGRGLLVRVVTSPSLEGRSLPILPAPPTALPWDTLRRLCGAEARRAPTGAGPRNAGGRPARKVRVWTIPIARA